MSPGPTVVTCRPTSSTVPAPSCPRTAGSGVAEAPEQDLGPPGAEQGGGEVEGDRHPHQPPGDVTGLADHLSRVDLADQAVDHRGADQEDDQLEPGQQQPPSHRGVMRPGRRRHSGGLGGGGARDHQVIGGRAIQPAPDRVGRGLRGQEISPFVRIEIGKMLIIRTLQERYHSRPGTDVCLTGAAVVASAPSASSTRKVSPPRLGPWRWSRSSSCGRRCRDRGRPADGPDRFTRAQPADAGPARARHPAEPPSISAQPAHRAASRARPPPTDAARCMKAS